MGKVVEGGTGSFDVMQPLPNSMNTIKTGGIDIIAT